MKKLFSLALAILVAFSFVGCGDKKADNKYVESAKKYGYWYGLGGISWGMSIDETLSVLGVKREDTITVPNDYSDILVEITTIGVNTKIYDIPVIARFHFYKAVNKVGALSEKEWLARIEFIFSEAQSPDVLNSLIQADLKALNLSYEEKNGTFSNKQTLFTLTDKNQGEKAIALYEDLISTLPEGKVTSPVDIERPIDRITYQKVGEEKTVIMLSLTADMAAYVALA